MKGITRRIGSRLSVLYPQHGKKNILCSQEGDIRKTGVGPNGRYIEIQREDGTIRRLSENKIVIHLGNK
jgi:hypothetical protein